MLKDKNGKYVSIKDLERNGELDSFIDEIQYNCSKYYLDDVLCEVLNYYLAQKINIIEKIDKRVSIEFTDTPSEIKASELNKFFVLVDTTDRASSDIRRQIFPESKKITPTEYTAKVNISTDFSWEELLKLIANSYFFKIVEELKAIDQCESSLEIKKVYVKIDNTTSFYWTREDSLEMVVFSKEVGIYKKQKGRIQCQKLRA